MVDFCICIDPSADKSASSGAAITIDSLRRKLPGASINHTEYPAVSSWPIAASIETKPPHGDWAAATLQIGVWQAAQLRCLRRLGYRPDFVPGIVIQGHDWSFVASVPGKEDGKGGALFTKIHMGGTETVLGIYSVVASLRRLLRWIEDEFWREFQTAVLASRKSAL